MPSFPFCPPLLKERRRKVRHSPLKAAVTGTNSGPCCIFTPRLLGWIRNWAGPLPRAWLRFHYGQFIFDCAKIKSSKHRHHKLFIVIQLRKTKFIILIVLRCVIQWHLVQPPPLSVSGHIFTAKGNPGSLSGQSQPLPRRSPAPNLCGFAFWTPRTDRITDDGASRA